MFQVVSTHHWIDLRESEQPKLVWVDNHFEEEADFLESGAFRVAWPFYVSLVLFYELDSGPEFDIIIYDLFP